MDRPERARAGSVLWGKPLALVLLLLAAFTYGFASARYRVFPYDLILGTYRVLLPASSPPVRAVPPPGMWVRARNSADDGSMADMEAVRKLANTGYAAGYVPSTGEENVTRHDPEAAHEGLNLVVSGHAPEAFLMDMQGNAVHRWSPDLEEVWRDREDSGELVGLETFWRRAHLFPNGELLAIYDGIGLIKLSRSSELLWANMGRMHHDLEVDEHGDIYTLTRHTRRKHDRLRLEGRIEEDFITVLDSDGVEVSRTSVLSCFLDSDYYAVISLADKQGDILHTNTIELLDGRFESRHSAFARGNVLISVPTLNTIAIIDLEQEKVVWALGGQWQFQHQPTMLAGGNILLFDNLGENGRSKVIELDPLTQEILWAYRDSPEHELSSYFLGSCQRLSNGNTLITESAMGRALEVTPDGTNVWEYLNPHRAGDENELIASLLEVVRFEYGYFAADFAAELRKIPGGEPEAPLERDD